MWVNHLPEELLVSVMVWGNVYSYSFPGCWAGTNGWGRESEFHIVTVHADQKAFRTSTGRLWCGSPLDTKGQPTSPHLAWWVVVEPEIFLGSAQLAAEPWRKVEELNQTSSPYLFSPPLPASHSFTKTEWERPRRSLGWNVDRGHC